MAEKLAEALGMCRFTLTALDFAPEAPIEDVVCRQEIRAIIARIDEALAAYENSDTVEVDKERLESEVTYLVPKAFPEMHPAQVESTIGRVLAYLQQ